MFDQKKQATNRRVATIWQRVGGEDGKSASRALIFTQRATYALYESSSHVVDGMQGYSSEVKIFSVLIIVIMR